MNLRPSGGIALLGALLLLAMGCNGGSTPAEPKSDVIALASVDPPLGSALLLGTYVTITARYHYQLATATGGHVAASSFPADVQTDPKSLRVDLRSRSGDFTLRFVSFVPLSHMFSTETHVNFPLLLYPQDSPNATAGDTLYYTVAAYGQ
jgi:hypothetical protein